MKIYTDKIAFLKQKHALRKTTIKFYKKSISDLAKLDAINNNWRIKISTVIKDFLALPDNPYAAIGTSPTISVTQIYTKFLLPFDEKTCYYATKNGAKISPADSDFFVYLCPKYI